jgi:hypothetical protein
MTRYLYLILLIVPALALPAQAGIFGRKAPANPDQRVPELLVKVKTDSNETTRTAAVAELREFDSKYSSEIVPVMIDVLTNETKPGVRREAAITLGKLRPVNQAAGQALQQAASKDPSLLVRLQAWSSLKMYQMSGYSARTTGVPQPDSVTTVNRNSPNSSNTIILRPSKNGEPPLVNEPERIIIIDPKTAAPVQTQDSIFSRPLPSQQTPATQNPPRRFPPPTVIEDGPALDPRP